MPLKTGIKTQLVPTTRASYFDLMKIKPKNAIAEEASKALKDGYYNDAIDLFLKAWKENRHVASGYNAAIIYASNGDIDKAINLLQEMKTVVNDSTVSSTLSKLQTINAKNSDAKKQNSGERVNFNDSESNINIFQYIMGN